MVKKLNKYFIRFMAVLISVLFLSNIFTYNVNAVQITNQLYVTPVDFNVYEYIPSGSGSRTSTKPYKFYNPSSSGSTKYSIGYPYVDFVYNSAIADGSFWDLGLDIRIANLVDGQDPGLICPYTANDAYYVLDSCNITAVDTYPYDWVDTGQQSGSGVNDQLWRAGVNINHYYMNLSGHVNTSGSGNNYKIALRGPFMEIYGGYEMSLTFNNLRFYKVESLESQAINNQTEQQQEHYEEQQDQAEQQGQDSQDNSDETQSQVDGKTQNLFSFITSFFGAFTSASPSNCNFDWGLADKGFGVINMCQTNIPAELQSILSIVSILIVVPMVLWLINSIVNAFKEFQQ